MSPSFEAVLAEYGADAERFALHLLRKWGKLNKRADVADVPLQALWAASKKITEAENFGKLLFAFVKHQLRWRLFPGPQKAWPLSLDAMEPGIAAGLAVARTEAEPLDVGFTLDDLLPLLNERQAAAVTLRFRDGLTMEAIGRRLDVSKQRVEQLLRAAFKKMRPRLEGKGFREGL